MLVEDFITDRLNELCSRKKISRYKLSKLTGIQQSTLSNLMTKKSLPNIITLSRICDGLGITLSQFFQEGDKLPDLSDEQKHVLDTWAELDESEKNLVNIFVRGLLHK
ncbi:MAG: helix-turn-helix transcriptional regulator [Eubacterium sp.]|nr:helix-turn-helix transcriptional regulator [Eubacterium sp.]MCI8918366.1 helix-turn-helix transcriptional regulator [Eubacterium sp.]